jgi:hypothetical protein
VFQTWSNVRARNTQNARRSHPSRSSIPASTASAKITQTEISCFTETGHFYLRVTKAIGPIAKPFKNVDNAADFGSGIRDVQAKENLRKKSEHHLS